MLPSRPPKPPAPEAAEASASMAAEVCEGPHCSGRTIFNLFDTKKLKLLKHGVTLRVRKSGPKRLQTIKGSAGTPDGLRRAEREDNIKSALPQLKYAKGTPLAPFVTKKLKRKLGPVVRVLVLS
jgi:inorganic triphosphatase YgiF